ncbi:hypothetical protein SUGI_0409690 [Cryptomeria japonica]|nr:hypothetical protein SUGI_0409690 [Cryptomeria japonica]
MCDGASGHRGSEAARETQLGGSERGGNAFCSKRKVALLKEGRVGHRGAHNRDTPMCWEEQVAVRTTVNLDAKTAKEVYENEQYFVELGLIGRFQGLWPSLGARGFFMVIFDNLEDRKKIFCKSFWSWEAKHTLLLKPWYPTFKLGIESFDQIPIWVRLPNLPLQFWFESCFKVVGDSLGKILGADKGSLDYFHTAYAHILVEMDSSKEKPYLKALNKEVYKGKEDKQQAYSSPSNHGMVEDTNRIEVPPKNTIEIGAINSYEVTHMEGVRSLGPSGVPLSSIQENLS